MTEIRKMEAADVGQCVQIYQSAYAEEPWQEEYSADSVERYIAGFMNSDSMRCFVLMDSETVIGLALAILVPGIDAPYLRIEDFCMDAKRQGRGFGSRFMELIASEAEKLGCDSILLGTQREFPAHRFYLKNGFEEIESVLMYKEI